MNLQSNSLIQRIKLKKVIALIVAVVVLVVAIAVIDNIAIIIEIRGIIIASWISIMIQRSLYPIPVLSAFVEGLLVEGLEGLNPVVAGTKVALAWIIHIPYLLLLLAPPHQLLLHLP